MFVVTRTFGINVKRKDYLMSLDKVWGTACIGDITQAMTFFTREEAEMQAARAQQVCKGVGGVVDPKVYVFSVMEI